MKIHVFILPVLFGASSILFTGCAGTRKKPEAAPSAAVEKSHSDGKTVKATDDDLDEYSAATVADPLEPLNRATFMLNDGLYTVIFRPVSKVYEKALPKLVRQGIYNAYENVKFPIRVVNDTLQGNLKRAGLETGKFLVNSTVGVGGLGRPSDHIPALADVPSADTAQTFAKWGIGNGFYLVLPVLGPSTLRDAVGLAGDYALNPITWICFVYGDYAWIIAIPSANTVRSLPGQLSQYDAITKDALDRYLAARTAYIQYRKAAASR